MSRLMWFAAGFVLAAVLLHMRAVEAATNYLMFGSVNGTATVLQVDTNGFVKVRFN